MDNTFKIGDTIEGIVTGIKSYGIYFSFPFNYIGLLHINEISNSFVPNLNGLFYLGDKVDVTIKSIDFETKFLSLSIKNVTSSVSSLTITKKSNKIVSYLDEIDFSSLKDSLPSMIKAELEREKYEFKSKF